MSYAAKVSLFLRLDECSIIGIVFEFEEGYSPLHLQSLGERPDAKTVLQH